MRFVDIVTIVSGAASIISLFLMIGDRFAAWKKYILPLSYGLGGFAAGRISAALTSGSTSTAIEGYPSAVLTLFVVILLIISVAAFMLLKRNEPIWAYLILMIGLSSAAPQVMRSFSESTSHVPIGDLLVLATEKERVSDLSGAINYLDKASKVTSDASLREQIDSRLKALEKKLADSINEAHTTPSK